MSVASGAQAENSYQTGPPKRPVELPILLASQGWIEPLRPLFRSAMEAYLKTRGSLVVTLEPLSGEVRAALESVHPGSPDTWFSRLAQRTGHSRDEQQAIEAVRAGLALQPLAWHIKANAPA